MADAPTTSHPGTPIQDMAAAFAVFPIPENRRITASAVPRFRGEIATLLDDIHAQARASGNEQMAAGIALVSALCALDDLPNRIDGGAPVQYALDRVHAVVVHLAAQVPPEVLRAAAALAQCERA